MKKHLFFSFLLMLALSFSVSAQKRRVAKKVAQSPEEAAQKLTDKMAEVMKLDDAMKQAAYDINLKAAQDMASIRERIKTEYPNKGEVKANREAIKAKYGAEKKAIRKTRSESLKALNLTKAQWNKWKAYKKRRKAQIKTRKTNGKPVTPSLEDELMDGTN